MDNYKIILEYVNNSPWKDDTNYEIIIEKANLLYEDIIKGKSRERILYRLCGQTGSGKTTQLLFSINEYMKYIEMNPVIVGVRSCVRYHPRYNELLKEYGENNIREVTNGFSLKCLTYLLYLLIKNGYMIVLDMTLLSQVYEEYVLNLLKKYNYQIEYHIMAVHNDISKIFLEKRSKEIGRVVNDTSRQYFNLILENGLTYLVNNDRENVCYIWGVFDKNPVYIGKIKDCFDAFKKEKECIRNLIYNEEELKLAKIKYLIKNRK